MRIYSYWECDLCESLLRGDLLFCPKCGSRKSDNVKYLMPNNPKVQEAIISGNIYTKNDAKIYIDKNGNLTELVNED